MQNVFFLTHSSKSSTTKITGFTWKLQKSFWDNQIKVPNSIPTAEEERAIWSKTPKKLPNGACGGTVASAADSKVRREILTFVKCVSVHIKCKIFTPHFAVPVYQRSSLTVVNGRPRAMERADVHLWAFRKETSLIGHVVKYIWNVK